MGRSVTNCAARNHPYLFPVIGSGFTFTPLIQKRTGYTLSQSLYANRYFYAQLLTPEPEATSHDTSLADISGKMANLTAHLQRLERTLGSEESKFLFGLIGGGTDSGGSSSTPPAGSATTESTGGQPITGASPNNHFNPAQPRVPAGSPDGGQWTDAGGTLDDGRGAAIIDPNTGKPYPKPYGMDIRRNVARGRNANAANMVSWFRHYGSMDYQRSTGRFNGALRNVTNYNYGAVSAAAGYSLSHSLEAAGFFNRNFGRVTGTETSYGIRPDAVANITQGWNDYYTIWSH